MRAVRSGSGAPAAAVLVLVALLLAACSTTPERPAHRPPGSAASAPASPSPSGTSPSPAAPQPTGNAEAEFEVGTFNTLGASHTRPGGTMADRPPGRIRGRWAAQVLRRAGVDLVGLQEFEPAQLRAFRTVVHRTWALYPGLRHGEYGLANSVAWRRSVWVLEDATQIAIPYFGGRPREMPVVTLRHRASGQRVSVINVHNPATTPRHGDNARWRQRALRLEVREVVRLRRAGRRVLLLGDFNAVRPVYCALTRTARMHAAVGGRAAPSCAPRRGAGVDWIFGSAGVRFLSYRVSSGPLVRRTSDHPLVTARAALASD